MKENIVLGLLLLAMVVFIATATIVRERATEYSKLEFYAPAGRPDSIPCSSEVDARCMVYVPKEI